MDRFFQLFPEHFSSIIIHSFIQWMNELANSCFVSLNVCVFKGKKIWLYFFLMNTCFSCVVKHSFILFSFFLLTWDDAHEITWMANLVFRLLPSSCWMNNKWWWWWYSMTMSMRSTHRHWTCLLYSCCYGCRRGEKKFSIKWIRGKNAKNINWAVGVFFSNVQHL